MLGSNKYNEFSFIFDIDGTICPIKRKDEKYEELVPFTNIVEKMRELKGEGAKIILFTSRNMNSYNGNIGLINKHTAKTLLEWLETWDIPYDEIIYGKPWPGHKGYYVDDRAIRPEEFLKYNIDEIENIIKESSENL